MNNLADSVSMETINKSDLNRWKSRDALEHLRDLYVKYSTDDANKLLSIYFSFVNLMRRIQNKVIGIPIKDRTTGNDIPMTIGSSVALTSEKLIYS